MQTKTMTKKQRDTVDMLFSEDGSLEKILEKNGIPVRRFLQWMQDEAFARYLKNQSDARIAAAAMSAWSALIRGVAHGDPASIKLFFEIRAKEQAKEQVKEQAKAGAGEQEKKPPEAGLTIQMDLAAREAAE